MWILLGRLGMHRLALVRAHTMHLWMQHMCIVTSVARVCSTSTSPYPKSRKHHPAASRMRRAELEAYLRRAKIKPIGKELPKLKRDHCDKPAETPQPRRSKRKKASTADEDEFIAAASELTQPVTGPKKKKRGRPRKSTLLNTDAGAQAVQDLLPDLEQRAAQMDEDDSLAW
eukprot:COSAG01_NODE_2495_length_7577_cov_26.851565_1_plen_172_part_00